jgi:hypothetical protein
LAGLNKAPVFSKSLAKILGAEKLFSTKNWSIFIDQIFVWLILDGFHWLESIGNGSKYRNKGKTDPKNIVYD